MKKLSLIFFLLFNLLYSQNIDSLYSINGSFIVTSEMLRTSGITNISDIISLKENWFVYTIDGSGTQIYPDNLNPMNRQNLIILIDGQRFDINIFDVQNLNAVPISIDQVDFVEFIDAPRIINGEFADHGLINIHTKTPAKGLSVAATHAFGNETGDPGPFAYTKFKSPNIDKILYNFGLNIAAAGENWILKGNYKGEQVFETDPLIKKRISYLSLNDKSDLASWSASLSFNAFNGSHSLFTGHTSNYEFFFLKPYGNEIPVNRIIRHYGLGGYFGIDKNIGIRYELKSSKIQLEKAENNYNIEFDWGMSNYLGKLECQYNSQLFSAKFGLVSDYYIGQTNQVLKNNSFLFQKFYTDFNLKLNKNISQSIGLMGLKWGEENAFKIYFSNFWVINKWNRIFLNASVYKRLYGENLDYLNWVDRNYTLPLVDNNNFQYFGSFNHENGLTIDLDYRFTYNKNLFFDVKGSYRNLNKFSYEEQYFQFNPVNYTFDSKSKIYFDGSVSLASINLSVDNNIGDFLSHRVFYNFQTAVGGNELINEQYKMFYTHIAGYQLTIKADETFSIWSSLKYYSPVQFSDYRYIDYQSGQLYNKEVKEKLLLDLSVQKWFWGKKVWTNILFKNILNETDLYYPVGASFALRFYFQIHLYFDSILQ